MTFDGSPGYRAGTLLAQTAAVADLGRHRILIMVPLLVIFSNYELPRGKPRSIGAKTTGVARNEAGYIPLPYLDSEYISESPSHYPFCRRY